MSFVRRLLISIAAVPMLIGAVNAETGDRLGVAAGKPGSDSFAFATELWAMSQIALMPTHGVALEAREVTADDDRLALLQDGEVEAALVYGRVPNAYEHDVRAIMALWPLGQSDDDSDPVQFLVHKTVSADVVYLVTKAMFENGRYFKNTHSSLGVGHPGEAMTGLDIPLHAGAYRYYQERGLGQDAPLAADYWGDDKAVADVDPKTAPATYRNFDDPALDAKEIEQIAAACRQALDAGSLTLLLGDLATTGCEVYQDELVDGEKQTVSDTTTISDGDTLDEAPVGQGGPAIRWTPSGSGASASDRGLKLAPARVIRQPVM